MEYQTTNGMLAGIADLTIAELAAQRPEVFSASWIVLTMLDSSPVSGFQNAILKSSPETRVVGDALVVRGHDILALIQREDIFQHFDEMYLCGAVPASADIHTHFTSERANFAKHVPQEFLTLFQSLRAVRYFSDGCGLNFVCENLDLVSAIELAEERIDRGYSYLGSSTSSPTL